MATHDSTERDGAAEERGMTIARAPDRVEIALRPVGAGRFASAGFLGVWLAGWAAGEAFALWLIVQGGWKFFYGTLPGAVEGGEPPTLGAALGIAAFLMGWTAFWTLGGVLAGTEFLRLVWGCDRLVANARGLEIVRQAGPFRRRRFHPREELHRLYSIQAGGALMIECSAGGVELTRLGTPDQKDRIAAMLTTALRLAPPEGRPAGLPDGWEAERAPEGGMLLVQSQSIRRTRARVAGGFAAAMVAVAGGLGYQAVTAGQGSAAAGVAGGLALGAMWLAWWTWCVRAEWRITDGRIVRLRRVGRAVREQFVGDEIILAEHSDSDGDIWYKVEIAGQAAGAEAAGHNLRKRRTVHSQLHDPTEPRRIAAWLAAEAGLPVTDGIKSPAEKAAETAELMRKLAESGRFGRWMAGALSRRVAKRE